jgi:hypothetical protein
MLVEAVGLDPSVHEAWFDLGLLHKWSGAWDDALRCNLRAAELVGERADEPAWWNLGIAATALRDWDVARRAWRVYGLTVPDGEGPIAGDYGLAAVRINPHSDPEVVWGRRVDPARLRIESVPLPGSGHRWGDIVLHDGEPVSTREVRGVRHLVFNELERWEASGVPTVAATVSSDLPAAISDLLDALEEAGLTAEDWTTNTAMVCAACSTRHEESPPPVPVSGRHEHAIGIAAPIESVRTVVAAWERSHGGRCHELTTA